MTIVYVNLAEEIEIWYIFSALTLLVEWAESIASVWSLDQCGADFSCGNSIDKPCMLLLRAVRREEIKKVTDL